MLEMGPNTSSFLLTFVLDVTISFYMEVIWTYSWFQRDIYIVPRYVLGHFYISRNIGEGWSLSIGSCSFFVFLDPSLDLSKVSLAGLDWMI